MKRLILAILVASLATSLAAVSVSARPNPLVPISVARAKANALLATAQSIRRDIASQAFALNTQIAACKAVKARPHQDAEQALETIGERLGQTVQRRGLDRAKQVRDGANDLLDMAANLTDATKETAAVSAAVELRQAGTALARGSIALIGGFSALGNLDCVAIPRKIALYKTEVQAATKHMATADHWIFFL